MKIINNNKLLEEINNVGEIGDKITPQAPVSFADAVKDAREQEDKIKAELKKHEEETTKDLDNTEKDRLEGNKIKRPEGSKKLHLEESLFNESFLDGKSLKEVFFSILPRSKQYEMDLDGNLIITDYNYGNKVGIHLYKLDEYDLDDDIFFDPNDEDEDLDEGIKDKKKSNLTDSKFAKKYPDRFKAIKAIFDEKGWSLPSAKDLDEVATTLGVDIDEAWRKEKAEGDEYLVSPHRAPLADLIQKYLIAGEHEWGYVRHPDGTTNPTPLKGAEYLPSQVGIDKDFNIKVTVADEEELDGAKKIADKFGREYGIISYKGRAGACKYPVHMIIKLEEDDWDKPYVNPNDKVYDGPIIKKEVKKEDEEA